VVSDESIEEVRRVSEWVAEQEAAEEKPMDLIFAIMNQSARDLEHTNNLLIAGGFDAAARVARELIAFWCAVDAAAEVNSPRALDRALYSVDIYSLEQSLLHFEDMANKMAGGA
jgi:hypothetical protein